MIRRLLPLLLLAAAPPPPAPPAPPPASAGDDILVQGRPYGPCGPRYAPLYIAPMGEPVRTNGHSDPMARWFAAADADHDGRLTQAELAADAERYARTLDTDGDGELDPQEVSAYENDEAPEIKLYQPGLFREPHDSKGRRAAKREARERVDYVAAYGAGHYASLNVPEPIASADLDINRGVSMSEIRTVAAQRFALLDPGARGYLSLDALPRSPAQQAIDACFARQESQKK
ncbi:EF-hand domain-containing protein [Sphingomonas morindae]|uniref:EF-hand domain-containing protein n=1 Tax=Sphingomonas morindae TaxID=1541170 RepID=A0ABY4XB45_9SPHN|nr:EF-hand domain-containing protein [Sphingomonas morindae]USI74185.1 EF-hand domain-containing protein [Sphingomonas morindae]